MSIDPIATSTHYQLLVVRNMSKSSSSHPDHSCDHDPSSAPLKNKKQYDDNDDSGMIRKRKRSDENTENMSYRKLVDEGVSGPSNDDNNSSTKTTKSEEATSLLSTTSKKQTGTSAEKGKPCADEEEKYRRERRLAMNRKTAKIRRDRAIDRLENLKTTCNDLISRNDVIQKENGVFRERIKEVELVLEKNNIDYKELFAKSSSEDKAVLALLSSSAATNAASSAIQEQDQLALLSANAGAFSLGRTGESLLQESNKLPSLESSSLPSLIQPTSQISSWQEPFGGMSTTHREGQILNPFPLPALMVTPLTGAINPLTSAMNNSSLLNSVTNQSSLLGMTNTPQHHFRSSIPHPNQHVYYDNNQGLLLPIQSGLQQTRMAPQFSNFRGNFPSQAIVFQHDMLHSTNPANQSLLQNASNLQSSILLPLTSRLAAASSQPEMFRNDITVEREKDEEIKEEESQAKSK